MCDESFHPVCSDLNQDEPYFLESCTSKLVVIVCKVYPPGLWFTSRDGILFESGCTNAKSLAHWASSPASYADMVATTETNFNEQCRTRPRKLKEVCADGVLSVSEGPRRTPKETRCCSRDVWSVSSMDWYWSLRDATTTGPVLPDFEYSWSNCHLTSGEIKSWRRSSARYLEKIPSVVQETVADPIRVKSNFHVCKFRKPRPLRHLKVVLEHRRRTLSRSYRLDGEHVGLLPDLWMKLKMP